jgi:hypothetical protein
LRVIRAGLEPPAIVFGYPKKENAMNARLRRGRGTVKSRLGLLILALALTAVAVGASGALAAGKAAHSTDACPAGSKRAVIGGKVQCLHAGQRCKSRYQAAYKRAGFTCTNGRLHKRATAPPPVQPPPTEPPPTPQPPPAPPAQPGHYHGLTSQLTTVDFDVSADGRGATNISTGQINQGCTPPGHISGGGIEGASRPIATDGTFVVNFDFQGTFSDGTAYSGNLNMTGHFSGSSASGTLSATLNFTDNGTAYACGSGQQTWTATRTG